MKKITQTQGEFDEFCPACGHPVRLDRACYVVQRTAFHPACVASVRAASTTELIQQVRAFAQSAGDTITEAEAIDLIRGILR
jgi:hypothetical protein